MEVPINHDLELIDLSVLICKQNDYLCNKIMPSSAPEDFESPAWFQTSRVIRAQSLLISHGGLALNTSVSLL